MSGLCLGCDDPDAVLFYGNFCRACATVKQDRANLEDREVCATCGHPTFNRCLLCDECLRRDEANRPPDPVGRGFSGDLSVEPGR